MKPYDPWSMFRDERGSISISRVQQVGAFLLILGGEIASLIAQQKFAPIPNELLIWAGLGTLQYLGAKGITGLSGPKLDLLTAGVTELKPYDPPPTRLTPEAIQNIVEAMEGPRAPRGDEPPAAPGGVPNPRL